MSDALPKEKQTAYERWELASFGNDRGSAGGSARPSVRSSAQPAAVKLSDDQLASLREEAKQAGHAAGLAEGRAAGRAEIARELSHLRRVAESFTGELAQANETIAQDMLGLALDLAKAMLKTSLAARPELVLPIVGEAIRYLPGMQQSALLYLNPQDAAIVRDHMGEELAKAGWRIAEERQIGRGGCRVDTSSNQIDATMETRWQRLAESLGRESEWLEP